MTDESEMATWQEWRKGKVHDMMGGPDLATLLVPRTDGVDDYYEFMHFPEWVVDSIVADHNQARRVPRLEKALERIANYPEFGTYGMAEIARAALMDAEVNDGH